ncbi:tRNA uridine-5-carboxymethylaminomethyl(34) synthesis GTPase MnmE [Sulfurivermis fontis]|uniref:tRNA uridine-5-carboxymethylaminomethyl(34) synthesis GTPase MnmE n=1 Tax=Sulfurivermis fontis TaxID=1972068 RepID=UPI000FD72859|nr:tRNA uridine-5-carboxymethylaminomethyl(34) synthesis GTPase MnmE [Sulfurivermis fontis]
METPSRDSDTIAAVATPPGRGGVGIVRISGPQAATIAEGMLGRCPAPRHAEYLPFRDSRGAVIDQGIALYFAAPNSFTGEDVLELQGHGGPVVMDLLLQTALQFGARPARPGEFSQRAFLNDKLDLVQAEAIADLIDSTSVQAARSALRSMQGEFSRRVGALTEELIQLRLYVEAAIDFPEEEIDFLADGVVAARLAAVQEQLHAVQVAAQQGSLLREGMHVVLAGQPNAGKSSLLNALAGRDSAIVTDIPGTTRDVLREQISIDGMPLHIIDTAGLRESMDAIEQEGMRRAWAEIERADRVLLLLDDRTGMSDAERSILARLPDRLPITFIHNKIDLSGHPASVEQCDDGLHVYLSARSGDGLDLLREHLKQSMGYHAAGEGVFSARRRHLDALERAAGHLATGVAQLGLGAGELLAEELQQAQQALGEITGVFTADDLLGRIFSSFCIGK